MSQRLKSLLAKIAKLKVHSCSSECKHWCHHHCSFVIAALSRYYIDIYQDREVHQIQSGTGKNTWSATDQEYAIEEGRRQLNAQMEQLQFVTSRASILLPVGIATSAFFLTRLQDLTQVCGNLQATARALLIAGIVMAVWGAMIMGEVDLGSRTMMSFT